MSTLDKMRDRLNSINDPELLEVAKDLLVDMAEVQRLKQQIELREEKFSEGKRAAFYFFAMGMDPEELSHAANTATGRIRFLKEKRERELAQAGKDNSGTERPIEAGTVSVPEIPSPTFGGLGGSFGPTKKLGGL